MNLAPIVVFTYNRPTHTQETIESLKKNIYANESELYIFSDGGKDEVSWKQVEQVRKYLKTINGFKKVTIIESSFNKGLAKSIIFGANKMFENFERIIVLEDDILTSKYFLKYMNEALDMYQNENQVACISAYTYPIKNLETTFFIRGTDCQGWATWKRGWDLFEEDGQKLLDEIKSKHLEKEFDFNNSYPYTQMLQDQINGLNSSWAVRWFASAFLKDKLCLYPGKSMVQNIGFDNSGVHCINNKNSLLITPANNEQINLQKIEIKENKKMRKYFEKFFRKLNSKNPINEFLHRLSRWIKKKNKTKYGFSGDYKSWEDVEKLCDGYSASNILEKTLKATLKVKNGEAVFERDSVIFDEIQYSQGLLSSLLKAGMESKNELRVLDFGGSLGSHYFQNKEALKPIVIKNWKVVEQAHYVKIGNEKIADGVLNFTDSIEKVENSNILILSSVLQYLPNPYDWLEKFINKGIEYIIVDRTSFSKEGKDRLTLQKVSPEIYDAQYPAWFFEEAKFLSYFEDKYNLITDFDDTIDTVKEIPSYFKGFFFKLKV